MNQGLHIDVDAVLRQRAPGVRRLMPGFVVRWLERVICQREMNDMLDYAAGKEGAEFSRAVLEHLDIRVDVEGADNLPSPSHRRVTIVSNHPLGGLDGLALITWATDYWGGQVKFVVNDLLMAVEPLQGVFVPINKHGAQSRHASSTLEEAMDADDPVIIFPAGLVSRRGKGGEIKDLEWRKMFLTKSRQKGRDIIPVHFNGRNSSFFYKFAQLRKKSGLRFNIEMVRLPREIFLSTGRTYTITIGKLIPHSELPVGSGVTGYIQKIKEYVYSLPAEGLTKVTD